MTRIKSISCPNCGRYIRTLKKTDVTTHKTVCKGCGKWIWYRADGYRKIYDVPKRASCAGMRFY